jgi:small subunit ribosomal protein S14
MSKKCIIIRQSKRILRFKKFQESLINFKIALEKTTSKNEYFSIIKKLHKLHRDSFKTRIRNICAISGRSRGFLRYFGVSRIKIRDLISNGEVPGLYKASW